MKKTIFLLVFLIIQPVNAENLCPINHDIPEEMRILESDLTQDAAEKALIKLSRIISNPQEPKIWITVPNLNRTIEGYILKRDALAKLSINPKANISNFCIFMEKAFWFD